MEHMPEIEKSSERLIKHFLPIGGGGAPRWTEPFTPEARREVLGEEDCLLDEVDELTRPDDAPRGDPLLEAAVSSQGEEDLDRLRGSGGEELERSEVLLEHAPTPERQELDRCDAEGTAALVQESTGPLLHRPPGAMVHPSERPETLEERGEERNGEVRPSRERADAPLGEGRGEGEDAEEVPSGERPRDRCSDEEVTLLARLGENAEGGDSSGVPGRDRVRHAAGEEALLEGRSCAPDRGEVSHRPGGDEERLVPGPVLGRWYLTPHLFRVPGRTRRSLGTPPGILPQMCGTGEGRSGPYRTTGTYSPRTEMEPSHPTPLRRADRAALSLITARRSGDANVLAASLSEVIAPPVEGVPPQRSLERSTLLVAHVLVLRTADILKDAGEGSFDEAVLYASISAQDERSVLAADRAASLVAAKQAGADTTEGTVDLLSGLDPEEVAHRLLALVQLAHAAVDVAGKRLEVDPDRYLQRWGLLLA